MVCLVLNLLSMVKNNDGEFSIIALKNNHQIIFFYFHLEVSALFCLLRIRNAFFRFYTKHFQ